MFSTDFVFRQPENIVDNQKCQAGFRPLCNKILFLGLSYSNVPAQIIWFFMTINSKQADLQTTDSVLVFTRGAVLVLFGLLTLLELGGTTTVIFL